MQTIYKYELGHTDSATVEVDIPKGATVLSSGVQPGVGYVVWAAVDPTAEVVKRRFAVIPTGGLLLIPDTLDELPESATYVQGHTTAAGIHVFDLGEVG